MKKTLLTSFALFNFLTLPAFAVDLNCPAEDTCSLTGNYLNLNAYGDVVVPYNNATIVSSDVNFHYGSRLFLEENATASFFDTTFHGSNYIALSSNVTFIPFHINMEDNNTLSFDGNNSNISTAISIQNGRTIIRNNGTGNQITNLFFQDTSNSRIYVNSGDLSISNMINNSVTTIIYLGTANYEGIANFTGLANNHRLNFYINNGDSKINNNLNGQIYVYIDDLGEDYGYITSTSSSSLFENTAFTGTTLLNLSIEDDNEFVYDGALSRNFDNLRIKNGGNLTVKTDMTINSDTLVAGNGAIFLTNKELTINGYTDFEENAILISNITSPTEYGKITTDTIMLSRDAILNLSITNNALQKGQKMRLNLISANNFVEDSDYGTNFKTIITGLRYKVDFISAGVYDLTHLKDAYDMAYDFGGTKTEAEVGRALIDTGYIGAGLPLQPIFNNLNELSKTNGKEREFVNALNSLAPDNNSLQVNATNGVNEVFKAISNRFDAGKQYSSMDNKGMASGEKSAGRSALWAQMLYNEANLKDRGSEKGFDGKSSGLALGFETEANEDLKIGFGLNYIDTEIDGFLRKNNVDTYFFSENSTSYGFSRYHESKTVASVPVSSKYNAESFAVRSLIGKDYDLGGFFITPKAGLQYVNIKNHGYIDSVLQKMSGSSSDILTALS